MTDIDIVLPGASDPALRRDSARLLTHMLSHPGVSPRDLAAAIEARWPDGPRRAVLPADDRGTLLRGLHDLTSGRAASDVAIGGSRGGAVAVFPGQGRQRPGMLRPLNDASAAVRGVAGDCIARFGDVHGIDIAGFVLGDEAAPDGDETIFQASLFTQMIAVAALWEDAGLRISAAVGHSQGEIAAAVHAGMISAADGCAVVAARSRLVGAIPGPARTMGVVGLDDRSCRSVIAQFAGAVDIAVHNAPRVKVVAGDRDAVERIVGSVTADGGFARVLPVGYAAHTSAVEAIREGFLDEIGATLESDVFAGGRFPLLSSALCGARVRPGSDQASHWWANLRNPVRFDDAVREASRTASGSVPAFVEMSALRTLDRAIRETLSSAGTPDPDIVAIPTAAGSDPAAADDWRRARREALAHGLRTGDSPAGGSAAGFPGPVPVPSRVWFGVPRGESGDGGSHLPSAFAVGWDRLDSLRLTPPLPVHVDGSAESAPGVVDAIRAQGFGFSAASADAGPRILVCAGPATGGESDDVAEAVDALRRTLDALPPAPPGSRLVLLTFGAAQAGGNEPDPAQAACAPLARAAASERSWRFRHVDLPRAGAVRADAAAALAVHSRDEPVLAVRADGTYAPRMALTADPGRGPLPEALSHVLVTGGGRVASRIIHALVDEGAGRITVLTRTPDSVDAAIAAHARRRGVRFRVIRGDLSDPAGCARSVSAAVPVPATSVVHTASDYPAGDGASIAASARLRGVALEDLLRLLPTAPGCSVVVSSSIAVTMSHRDTASYAAAVSAAEAVAARHPDWRIIRWGVWPDGEGATATSRSAPRTAGPGCYRSNPAPRSARRFAPPPAPPQCWPPTGGSSAAPTRRSAPRVSWSPRPRRRRPRPCDAPPPPWRHRDPAGRGPPRGPSTSRESARTSSASPTTPIWTGAGHCRRWG